MCIVRIECPVLDVRGVGHAVGVPFLVSTFFVCDMGLCVWCMYRMSGTVCTGCGARGGGAPLSGASAFFACD